jgi:hypothetical protein
LIGKFGPPPRLPAASGRRPAAGVGQGRTSDEGSSRSSSFGSDGGFSFDSDSEPRERRGSDSSQSSATSQSSAGSGRSKAEQKQEQTAAAKKGQADLFVERDAVLADVVDNQRANHASVQDATASGSWGTLNASSATFGNPTDQALAHGELGRDRLLLNLANAPLGDSGAVGVVAGCAFGSFGHTDASGLTVSAFGGSNGPVSFAGASISKTVGAATLGATVMPLVNASAKTEVLEVGQDDARVAFKARRDTTAFIGGAATAGMVGVGARVGLSVFKEMQVIRTVPKEEARKALKKNAFGKRTALALQQKSAIGVPDLRMPLGGPNGGNKPAFAVGDEVQSILRGTFIGGVSLVAGGAHLGANVSINGEMELAVKRMPDDANGGAIMRVVVTPKRMSAGNLALDIPLLGVMDVSTVRGQLMRSVWDLNLATEGGKQAYDDVFRGRLPQAPVAVDFAKNASPEQLLAQVQGVALPDGVTLAMVEQSRLTQQLALGAAITAPMYLAGGRLGKLEVGKSKSDTTSTVSNAEIALERRERRAGWTAELLKFGGSHRSVEVLEERLTAGTGDLAGLESERFLLSARLSAPRRSEPNAKRLAALLEEKVLAKPAFEKAKFFAKESRDALEITAGRTLSPGDVVDLVQKGEVQGSDELQERLAQTAGDPLARHEVVKEARARLAARVMREGVAGLGRIHRALSTDDSALTFSLADTGGQRLQAKAQQYAVRFFRGLESYSGKRGTQAVAKRLQRIGKLMDGVERERELLGEDPLALQLLTAEERQERLAALDRVQSLVTPLLDLDALAAPQARRILFDLAPADSLRLLQLQPTARRDNQEGEAAPAAERP